MPPTNSLSAGFLNDWEKATDGLSHNNSVLYNEGEKD